MPSFSPFPIFGQSVMWPRAGGGRVGSFLTGAVTRFDGTPGRVRVEVRTMGGQIITSTFSDSSGEWEVTGLNPAIKYQIRIKDPSQQLNGAVLDWVDAVVD